MPLTSLRLRMLYQFCGATFLVATSILLVVAHLKFDEYDILLFAMATRAVLTGAGAVAGAASGAASGVIVGAGVDMPSSIWYLGPMVALASLLTSIVALMGFVLTGIISWRKERRERDQFELDCRKKQLEIEKLQSELMRLKELSKGTAGET